VPNKQYFLLNPGENLQRNVENVRGIRNQVSGIALKTVETVIKYGAEVATACDPVAAAIDVGGKKGVGVSLSRFSASQCAGIVGVIVSSITPQVVYSKVLFFLIFL
jgi:hypothetical protein